MALSKSISACVTGKCFPGDLGIDLQARERRNYNDLTPILVVLLRHIASITSSHMILHQTKRFVSDTAAIIRCVINQIVIIVLGGFLLPEIDPGRGLDASKFLSS